MTNDELSVDNVGKTCWEPCVGIPDRKSEACA